MRRFYFDTSNVLQVGKTITLTDTIYHHWCKVLRANVGEQAIFFDGNGGEYRVTLTDISKKLAQVNVESFDPVNRALPYHVNIGLVMSRGDRMDYAIQKATEMGVTSIQLLTSERCEVRLKTEQIEKKLEHWQGVAIAACEQCGLNYVPVIYPPLSIENWLLQLETNIGNLAAHSDAKNGLSGIEEQTADDQLIRSSPTSNELSVKLVLAVPTGIDKMSQLSAWSRIQQSLVNDATANFYLLIGAEGGLTDIEVSHALTNGFLAWQIGERVLRTETAPVVALAALQSISQMNQLKTNDCVN